jgi:hypothetical protein
MMWNPSDLALVAYVLLVGALLTEGYLTYRDWYQRRRAPHTPTPRPRLVVRRYRDQNDQAPYGTGTSLTK